MVFLLRDFALLSKGDKDLLSGWLRYGLHVRSNIGCEIRIARQEKHQNDGFHANWGHACGYKTKRKQELRGSKPSSRTYLRHTTDYTHLHSPLGPVQQPDFWRISRGFLGDRFSWPNHFLLVSSKIFTRISSTVQYILVN